MPDIAHLSERSHAERMKRNLPFIPAKMRVPHKSADCFISRYADDVMDLEVAIDQPNVSPSARYIDFTRYDIAHQDLLKAYAWCELNVTVFKSARWRGIRPARLRREVERVAHFLRFVESRGSSLRAITKDDFESWLDHAGKQSQALRAHAARPLRKLSQFRDFLPVTLSPAESIFEIFESVDFYHSKRPSENLTPRVPHNVLDPIIKWSLFYIKFASEDIMSMLKLQEGDRISYVNVVRRDDSAIMPGTQTRWRVKGDVYNLNLEIRCLVTAGYFIAGFLSGMRDSEVQDIKRDAWGVKRDADGRILHCFVKSRTFKSHAPGKERPWVVIEEVIEALDTLSRLRDCMERFARHPEGTQNLDLIFRRFTCIKSAAHSTALHNAAIADGMSKRLNEFQAHAKWLFGRLISRAANEADLETIERNYRIAEGPDGTDWRWKTKHLRRTIAWYIGNEPFGVVAGKRQYGHLRDVTFQGYGGDPESGFRDEVQRARELGQQRDILDLYNQVAEGRHLAGPAGKRIEGELAEISKKLGDLPGKVVDESRLKAMLKNVAKVIYPLILNDCFFDADKALCLVGARADARKAPIPAQCDPEKCPNSAVSRKHEAIIDASLADARAQRRQRGISKNQRAAIDVMINKYERIKRGFTGGC